MRVIHPDCGGVFICTVCERVLTHGEAEKLSAKSRGEDVHEPAINSALRQPPAVRRYLGDIARQQAFPSGFARGPRGGAMVDFGSLIVLECYLPFVDEERGDILPFVPMPLTGQLMHDVAKSDRRLCEVRLCRCDDRPEGWYLTRPILRAMLGVTDSYLNEHSIELPGRLHTWELRVSTLPFMRDFVFDREFTFSPRSLRRNACKAHHAKRALAKRKELRRTKSTPPPPLRRPPLGHGGKPKGGPK